MENKLIDLDGLATAVSEIQTINTKNNTVSFTVAEERANIATNEKHSVIFGKIAKWFSSLNAVAFSGSYSDLDNKPEIITTNDNIAYEELEDDE